MPVADVFIPHDNFRQQRFFNTPKQIQKPEAWVREIRIAIPQVPDIRSTDWTILHFDADVPTQDWLSITLINSLQQRIKIVVNRTIKFGQ